MAWHVNLNKFSEKKCWTITHECSLRFIYQRKTTDKQQRLNFFISLSYIQWFTFIFRLTVIYMRSFLIFCVGKKQIIIFMSHSLRFITFHIKPSCHHHRHFIIITYKHGDRRHSNWFNGGFEHGSTSRVSVTGDCLFVLYLNHMNMTCSTFMLIINFCFVILVGVWWKKIT